ncbi:MAG: MobF family relaxase [Spirosomataceae bacterium]
MIRMIQSSSAAGAKTYFSEALSKADYYLNDQELRGEMHGKLAERLDIAGPTDRDIFFALCENRHPKTEAALTPRTKEERITGYDINFHCPKSVSILHALSGDEHILQTFQQCVRQTMQDMEADAMTRVRKDHVYEDRRAGELVWSEFIHQTARPVEGHAPDPHLHAHCFVFNATWDQAEQQFKAVRFRDIKRDMPYYQARFHKRLADGLMAQGYQIQRTEKSFEVDGVPQRVIDLFSKRTDEIGRVAKEKGITDAKELDELGARTRSKKEKGLSMTELKTDWKQQITQLGPADAGEGKRPVRFASVKDKSFLSPERCVEHALQHGFERASVVQDRRLLAEAYRHSIGHRTVAMEEITRCFEEDTRILHVRDKHKTLCTIKEVLSEEQHMVRLARQGIGQLRPLYRSAPELSLTGRQADAVRHLLTTTDRVSIIQGAAGSGKTTLMQQAVRHIRAAGKTVTVVAPTAEASRGVLQSEGFQDADTVKKLLADPKKQQALYGQVLWVDEAGLLGTKDMAALLELSHRENARLVLGGDTRQHVSVVRGDALRILNTVGGIKSAEVSKIYRQKEAHFRKAVEDLSKGEVGSAFERLETMGAIQTIDPLQPNEQLVKEYAAAIKKGKSALVISPTHQQGEETTQAIRRHLRQAGLIGKKEFVLPQLINRNLTEAQKGDYRHLTKGQWLQFNQHVPGGLDRGSLWEITESSEKGVWLKNSKGEMLPLPQGVSPRYDVLSKKEIGLSKGDALRITRNGFDVHKNRLNNGQLMEVISVKAQGEVELRHPVSKARYTLPRDYGHWTHAHCITSYASQGKTVDEVFIAQPAATFPATDAKQFYVSVSRARERVRIYTDDKEQLLEYAARAGERTSAIELMKKKNQTREMIQQRIREEMPRKPPTPAKAKTPEKHKSTVNPIKPRDYEPGI